MIPSSDYPNSQLYGMALRPSQVPSSTARVAVIGAGNVGATLAQRLAEKNIADVILLDVVAGRPQGVALDLMEARGVEHHDRQIVGTNDFKDTADADVVVITAGLPRRPGMSRDDLLLTNGKIVLDVTRQVMAHSPDAVLLVVTNPLDVMTYIAWKASGLPIHKVMGMAGVLDSSRFQTFIAMELGVSIHDINAMVLGSHGDLMVPLPRYSTVNGIPIDRFLDAAAIARLVTRTRNGGAEVVELLKTGGAYYAPASAVAIMVESIIFNQPRILPVAAYLQGQYGLEDIFIGVPCRLGSHGIESILELELTPQEQSELQTSADTVRKNLDRLGVLLDELGLK
jgi:malate dehydrogenase